MKLQVSRCCSVLLSEPSWAYGSMQSHPRMQYVILPHSLCRHWRCVAESSTDALLADAAVNLGLQSGITITTATQHPLLCMVADMGVDMVLAAAELLSCLHLVFR